MRLAWLPQPDDALLLEWKGKEALIRPMVDVDGWRLFLRSDADDLNEGGEFFEKACSPNLNTLKNQAESLLRTALRRDARTATRIFIEGADW